MAKKTAAAKTDPLITRIEIERPDHWQPGDKVPGIAEDHANLKLWRKVEHTPPAMTKTFLRDGRQVTTPDPHWQMRVCTSLWGPYGGKWGFRELSYTVHSVDDRVVVILSATFFYPDPDLISPCLDFPIINDEVLVPGQDMMKKLITNTRSKALSWLGFSADIFMGKFDDVQYVRDMNVKFEKQNALVEAVMVKVPTAANMEELQAHREKLHRLIANKTLDDDVVARELLDLCTAKEQELLA